MEWEDQECPHFVSLADAREYIKQWDNIEEMV
jgi:hypothetical protein